MIKIAILCSTFLSKLNIVEQKLKVTRNQSWTERFFFLLTKARHNHNGKYGIITTSTLPRINSYSTVFLPESWFSSLPIHISLNTHPTPSPTTPLTVPFSFFPFFSLFFLSSHQSTHTLFTFHLLPHAPVCSTLGSKTWQEWQNLNRKSVVKKSIFQTRKNSLRKSILYTVCLKSSNYWRTLLTSECDVHYFVKLSNKWPAHLVFRTVYAVINSLIVSFSNVHKIKSFLQNCQCIISFINNFLQNRKI